MSGARSLLTVVGGTYGERCAFPRYSEIYGSGLRAAAALAASGANIQFHTVADPAFEKNVEMKAATHGFALAITPTARAIWFSYLHPLSGGRLAPRPGDELPALVVAGEHVLQFGMVDARVTVTGKRVVYDPQSPIRPQPFNAQASRADELAVVLNRVEASTLTGSSDPNRAGREILAREKAVTVVIKDGPRGALVIEAGRETWIPPFATDRSFLIGSGDIFSAFFAQEWAVGNAAPSAAAERASLATASWCSTGVLPLELDAAKLGAVSKPDLHRAPRPRVYLAGPFFNGAQLWWVSHVRDVLFDLGLEVFSPYHDVGFVGAGNADVAAQDLKALDSCDVVLALLDGFDPGTLFEVGFARSKGIPVIGLQTEGTIRTHETMLLGTGCTLYDDFGSAAYQAYWSPVRGKA